MSSSQGARDVVRILFASSPFGTPRHRCEHAREGLAKLGVESVMAQVGDGDLLPLGGGCSHVVLNRVPFTADVMRAVAGLRREGARVLWDTDDLLFDPALLRTLPWVRARPVADRERLLAAAAQIREGMADCGAGLCATPRLALEAAGLGRASVVPNCVSDELVDLSLAAAASRGAAHHLTIGYPCGHGGLSFSFDLLKPALRVLLSRHPTLRLRIIGFTAEHGQGLEDFAHRVDTLPYQDWRALPAELVRFDVCVAPLADDRFNAGKSDVKYLEAALCRVPLVASRVGQYAETIRDGENGMLASGEEEWIEKLELLLADGDRRSALADAAHRDVLSHRRIEAMGAAVLRALAEG